MDDVLMIRSALENVHPRSLGEDAHAAFDRVLNGEAVAGTRVTSQRPSRLQLADDPVVREDGSLEGVSLFLRQKEAAASV